MLTGVIIYQKTQYLWQIRRNNQRRNERLLAYQFKLGSLNNKSGKIEKKVNTIQDVVDLSSWINATNPEYSLKNLKSILDTKEEYSKIYKKMKKEFWLDDI